MSYSRTFPPYRSIGEEEVQAANRVLALVCFQPS